MDFKLIKSVDGEIQDLGVLKLKNMLDDDSWPFSVNWLERVSDDTKVGYETDQDVAFYVLHGSGKVLVEGTMHNLESGDLIAFPRGTHWKFYSGLTLLAISSPRYDRTKRKYDE